MSNIKTSLKNSKTVEVDGKDYTLQRIPFKFYLDIMDRNTDGSGNLRKSGYIKDLFEHVTVIPKVKFSDFDNNFQAAFKLVQEIENFLSSKPGQEEDETEGKEEL